MGNQLVGIAPSQIYPVEHYLTARDDLQFESSMGSTRFLKVARATSEEGLVVVKVFVKHDLSLPLTQHEDKVRDIKKNLQNAVNCLPFQKIIISDRANLVLREFVKHSLYDRMSTRPFLTTIEKKWITFQVLCALHQCHKQKVCHGDIKLENILITSWNWVLLSDFASFKPTYLPEDNPADYSYFFDTSRRRTCYIAPERFIRTNEQNQLKDNLLVGDGPCYSGSLLPEMDIFSAGCALIELWTEGYPFEFSQLLAYRRGDTDLLTKHLQNVEDRNLRNLLTSMLSIDPKDRKSAELYLDQERGQLFPEYFYTFLQSYFQMFSSIPILPSDDKITRLHSDISQIIDMLGDRSGDQDDCSKDHCRLPPDKDGLTLITTVVTSCIRGLHHCNSKISCLEILLKLAEHTSSETVLDRILPYILHFTQDLSPNVRVAALDTLSDCLCLVKNLPRSDANVFPEYVLPAISPLATDSCVIVRMSYAKNIATLAETAVKFLEQSQFNNSADMPMPSYESELATLHDILQQNIQSLLTDSEAIVKQTLLESGITKLCVFFGRQKANDKILAHIVTFLNDKEDNNLRGAFYDCIVGLAAFIGWHCSQLLIPLLQQGFTDSEEFVIAKSIRAIGALSELGLLQKPSLTEFISECACYLNHPNLWIRHEVCGLISIASKILSPLDTQCKIMPVIVNHLKLPLIQVEKPELLLNCLHSPIPRNIYDAVIKFPDVNQLIETLRARRVARNRAGEGNIPKYSDMSTPLTNFFRRLMTEGLTDLTENQLLSMSHHLIKLNRYKTIESKKKDGRIMLDKRVSSMCQEIVLVDKVKETNFRKRRDTETATDWFGNTDPNSPTPSTPGDLLAGSSSTLNMLPGGQVQPTPTLSLVEYSMPERSFLQERTSECLLEFEALSTSLKNRYSIFSSRESSPPKSTVASNWKLNGTLVAHLHEHKSSVSKMTTLKTGGPLFASASSDGTVRLWDCNKLDGQQSINRSRQYYSANTPLNAIAVCDSGQSLAVAGKDGALLVLRLDSNSSKMALQQARHLDSNTRIDRTVQEQDFGPVVDMQPMDQGAQSLIVYATLYGAIVGWDIRMSGNAWRMESDLRNGVITTFCIDPSSSWLSIGTSSGRHMCWDLRFNLKIAEIKHPHEFRIRRVACHPTEPSCLISASQGNNEVFSWNIETNSRQTALWASPAPPLSNVNVSSHSVCALLPGVIDGQGFVITGGTDQRIRYWDLASPANCSMVVPAPKDCNSGSFTYDSRPIDGTYVIQEIQNPSPVVGSGGGSGSATNRMATEEAPRSGPELPSVGHHDVITDLVLCTTQKQTFIASSSRDGVIKLWK